MAAEAVAGCCSLSSGLARLAGWCWSCGVKGGILAVGFSLPGLGEKREAQDLGLLAGGELGILVGWASSSLLECLTDTTGVEPNMMGVLLLFSPLETSAACLLESGLDFPLMLLFLSNFI